MSFSRRVQIPSRVLAIVILAMLLAISGFAQNDQGDYVKPKSHLYNFIGPYTPRSVPQPNFTNTSRIDQVLKDGKMMLSLNDAIALALENNLDLAIARYNLSIADTDILRTKAGSSARGVNTGVVQGTPGGGVGGFGTGASGAGAGGTSGAAGGAGTGTLGLVSSTVGTGATIDSFDPVISSSFSMENQTTQISNPRVAGVNFQDTHTGTANVTYGQGFGTGTSLQVAFNNSRQSTNAFNFFVPQVNSSFRATVRQHLLSGFGVGPNMRFIRIAKNNREISDVAFRQQVATTVSQIQNIYWDLVNAYEDVKVKERSLALANKTLSDNRKQVEIGTLAPIEVVRAESEMAARNQDLIVSQTNLQLQQLLMKNAITRNMADPALASGEVIPTDTMKLAPVEPVVPTEDLIADALSNRPELSQAQIDLTNRDISKRATRNALLPSLDLLAWYGGAGLAGNPNNSLVCGSPGAPAPPNCIPVGTTDTGYGSALANLFNSTAPDKGIGFSLNIPLRNRSAQADQVRSELEYRQAQMRLQQLQNQVRIEVRNAQFSVTQNRARVDAAIKGRELATQSLDAEQKKYALGASTNFLVLQAQRDLSQSESNVVTAMAAYEKSKVELDRVTGRTLVSLGIELGDAERGEIKRLPNVPGVAPRQAPSVQSPTRQ